MAIYQGMNIEHIKEAKAKLKKRGQNITDVCREAGVAYSTLCRLERGDRKTLGFSVACKLELASGGAFNCEKLNPETSKLYQKVLNMRQTTSIPDPVQ
ncbi:MAG: hypothetical protein CSB47_10445 [Proteobacteria bacterium]|nr:MAG: hypothetical protein CSB47_10445 [Pseudomonadota bacterium]